MRCLKSLGLIFVALTATAAVANGVEKSIIPLPIDAMNIRITSARLELHAGCMGPGYVCQDGASAPVTLVFTVSFDTWSARSTCGNSAGRGGVNCGATDTYTMTGTATISPELAARITANHLDPMTLILRHRLEMGTEASGTEASENQLKLVVDVQAN